MDTIENYKYITQEIIDKSTFVVTSSDEFEEIQQFNERMHQNRKLRIRFLREYLGMICTNLLVIPIVASTANEHANLLTMAAMYTSIPDSWVVYTLLIALYVFLFVFFVVRRKDYDWRKCLAYTSLLVPVNIWYFLVVVSNCVLMFLFNKLDEQIKTEPNYPHFTRITVVYRQENKEEVGFDRYKNKNDIEYL